MYRNDLLNQLMRRQSPLALLCAYHDESTFYSNADQTTFWNDGQSQVLRQKSLGSSIMVSEGIKCGENVQELK